MKYSDITRKLFEYNDPSKKPKLMAWLGNSKVRHPVYHGTNVDFSVFNPELSGSKSKTGAPEGSFFFTDNPEVASSYTVKWQGDFSTELHPNANVMPLYIKMEKPLRINAKGESWKDILFKNDFYDINEIVHMVKKMGKYDGIIVNNVLDAGVGSTGKKPATTFIAFSPNQIKSVFSKEFKDSEDISESVDEIVITKLNDEDEDEYGHGQRDYEYYDEDERYSVYYKGVSGIIDLSTGSANVEHIHSDNKRSGEAREMLQILKSKFGSVWTDSVDDSMPDAIPFWQKMLDDGIVSKALVGGTKPLKKKTN